MSDEMPPGPSGAQAQGELDLFDYALIRNVVGYVFRGVRRHVWLSIVVMASILGLGFGVVALLPRTYHAESRLLANQNELIRALGNPRSALPSEDPTRAARELIFAHHNLVSLIKQTGLMKNWEETRPLVVKVKDTVVEALIGPLTEQDEIDMMVGTLEKRLRVETDRQTVPISIDWPNPQMAYLLVETAQQNFLETRHVTEMTAISEALSILEMHAGNVQKTVDDALRELERVREQRRRGAMVAVAAPVVSESTPGSTPVDRSTSPEAPRPGGSPAATEQELAQLKFLLFSKRRALQDLDDFAGAAGERADHPAADPARAVHRPAPAGARHSEAALGGEGRLAADDGPEERHRPAHRRVQAQGRAVTRPMGGAAGSAHHRQPAHRWSPRSRER